LGAEFEAAGTKYFAMETDLTCTFRRLGAVANMGPLMPICIFLRDFTSSW
jgi:hypothetical protein